MVKHHRSLRWLACLVVASGVFMSWRCVAAEDPVGAPAAKKLELWLYYATNLQVDGNVTVLEGVWRRAAAAGYTTVMLTDSKFSRLGELGSMEKTYFANVARVKALAAELGLRIVPVVFPLGWSNSMLWHNPNLAEGLPVRDTLFVVQDGQARLVADPPVRLEKPAWLDDNVRLEGNTATVDDPVGNSRLVFNFDLPQFRCYHLSVWIKTADFQGTPEIKVLAGERVLQYQSLGVARTQDWTRHDVVFNTLDNARVAIYFGVWGGGKGRLQWRDWQIEEAGLVNLLRRPGTPLVVRDEGGKAYVEGVDFEPVADPHLGNDPWGGEYRPWHEPPTIRTRLPNGTRLRVSWYYPPIIYGGAVMACLSAPETMELLRDEAVRVRSAWGADGYMMGHDEIRTMNQDLACTEQNLDAGVILADNATRCAGWLKGAEVCVWSDMFDPYHNARNSYYFVRGDLRGSWEGLDRSVTVVNWNFDQRDLSLAFFAKRGHRQVIAGYYDAPPEQVEAWLASASRVEGVVGVMYTTWQNNYQDLEAFARHCAGEGAKEKK